MSKMVCARSVAIVVLSLGLCGAPVMHAAAQDRSAADECAAIADDAERLACYDRALRAAPAPTAPAQADADGRAEAPRPDGAGPPAASDAATVTDPALVPAAGAVPDDDRGAETGRSRSRESERATVTVVIASVSENFTGLSTFVTDTGDVYVQTSTRSARYPDTPFTAVLEPATFGSFFLIPENERNRIRVSLRQ